MLINLYLIKISDYLIKDLSFITCSLGLVYSACLVSFELILVFNLL